jgi:hypothetical protein
VIIEPEADDSYSPTDNEQAEFDRLLVQARAAEAKMPSKRFLKDGREVIWEALPGSQYEFLRSTEIFEVLFHGTRGPGKTDSLIMAFAKHVGKGYGAAWRGIIFRQTYPQLADVQAKTEKWFKLIFGDTCKFNRSKMMWEWDSGEVLFLRHMAKPSDYYNYHGHEYPFIGWEELTNWATDECYKAMFSCCRSSTPGVPRMVRATTNPYGPGHSWIKARFNLSGQWWKSIYQPRPRDEHNNLERPRLAIHGYLEENTVLLQADPHYRQSIISSAANPAMAEAWLKGSWDIVAGGIFGDVWNPAYNIVEAFEIPQSWTIDRSFDWGSSRPFAVGWWAESDGSDVRMPDGTWRSTVRGDLFRIAEWYGWTGKPNQGLQLLATDIAKGIVERELAMNIHDRVVPGPADSAIMTSENGNCIALDMEEPVRIGEKSYDGVSWIPADKSPGSRIRGWEQVRMYMKNAWPTKVGPREQPGLFVFERCTQFIRTVPSLPRDEKKMDDVDTDTEDHIADEVRYKIASGQVRGGSGRTVGMF